MPERRLQRTRDVYVEPVVCWEPAVLTPPCDGETHDWLHSITTGRLICLKCGIARQLGEAQYNPAVIQ